MKRLLKYCSKVMKKVLKSNPQNDEKLTSCLDCPSKYLLTKRAPTAIPRLPFTQAMQNFHRAGISSLPYSNLNNCIVGWYTLIKWDFGISQTYSLKNSSILLYLLCLKGFRIQGMFLISIEVRNQYLLKYTYYVLCIMYVHKYLYISPIS